MKEEELDRLFKQKSELYRVEPSPLAWQQLEEGLQHRKGKKVWVFLSGAAAGALLLFGLWAHMVYSSSLLAPDAHVSQQGTPPKAPAMREQEVINTDDTALAEAKKREQLIKPIQKEVQNHPQTKGTKANSNKAATSVQQKEKESGRTVTSIAEGIELPMVENKTVQAIEPTEVAVEMPQLIAAIPDQTENIIISYSAEDEISENLPAAPDEPSASKQDEKDLSARTVVGFLKKVKENSSGSLADIREAKNELLSFRLGR